ncbi:MAG: hypothetical protein JRF48_07900 [Deltaproteobacteria bacterium]|nr:hypothetical protein [Deltaproteobacteria bacterium]
MSEGGRERRESGRAALELPVEYDRLNALLSDYTHNLSRGGTFIRTDRPLEGEASSGGPSGMGIAFVYGSPAHQEALAARLDRLMVQSLGPAAFEQIMGKPAPEELPDDA